MRDDDFCHRLAIEHLTETADSGRVEEGGGLVEDQYFRLHQEDASKRGPAFFSSAEMEGISPGIGFEVKALDHLHGTLSSFFNGDALIEQAKHDVFENSWQKQLILGRLKDEADLAAHRLQRVALHADAVDFDLALPLQDTVQVEGKGGLARAIGPEQGDAFAAALCIVDSTQNRP